MIGSLLALLVLSGQGATEPGFADAAALTLASLPAEARVQSGSPVIEPPTIPSPRVMILRWASFEMGFSKGQNTLLAGLRDMPFDGNLAEHEAEISASISDSLTPAQRRRWRQVSLQYVGLAALGIPAIANEAGVPAQLSRRIAARGTSQWQAVNRRIADLRLPEEPILGDRSTDDARSTRRLRKYIVEIVRAQMLEQLDRELATWLSPPQLAAWAKLTGAECENVRMHEDLKPAPLFPDYRLLSESAVRAALGIDPDTSERIRATLRRASMIRNDYMNPETANRQVQKVRSYAVRFLSDAQINRLKEISLQTYGVEGMRNPEVAKLVGMEPGQVRKLETYLSGLYRDERIRDFERNRVSPPPAVQAPKMSQDMRASMTALIAARDAAVAQQEATSRQRREMEARMIKFLTPEQLSRWRAVQGPTFENAMNLRSLYILQ
ncbi:MAG: hypothetical protein ACOYON_07505 [Fimbriimonas sp.]